MSMFSTSVNQALSSASRSDQASGRLTAQLTSGKKVQNPEDGPSTWLEASRAGSDSSYLDAVHTGLDEVSTNLNVVNTDMQAIGQYISGMQGQLQEALNFPAGDPNRQQFITNFNQLRGQIDQTVNTEAQTGARNLMSDPAADPQAGNLQVLVGPNGETRTVHAQELDTGPNGLNIPALDPATATDTDLQAAVTNLAAAQATLATRQMVLGADSADIQNYASQTSQVSKLNQSEIDSLTGVDSNEAAVELQSVQVRHSLAIQMLASINTDRQAVLSLLQG